MESGSEDFEMTRDVTPGEVPLNKKGCKLEENLDRKYQREELLGNIRKLAGIVIERLEEGSRERTFSIAQVRLLGSLGLRALRLWQEALKDGRTTASIIELRQAENHLSQELNESRTGGEQSS